MNTSLASWGKAGPRPRPDPLDGGHDALGGGRDAPRLGGGRDAVAAGGRRAGGPPN